MGTNDASFNDGTGIQDKSYQTDNSNSISSTTGSSLKVQRGWGQAAGGGTSNQSEAVTFPEAFTTILGVSISYMGQTSGSSAATDITGITNFTAAPVTTQAYAITTSGFTAAMYLATGSFSGTRYYAYSWQAWGL